MYQLYEQISNCLILFFFHLKAVRGSYVVSVVASLRYKWRKDVPSMRVCLLCEGTLLQLQLVDSTFNLYTMGLWSKSVTEEESGGPCMYSVIINCWNESVFQWLCWADCCYHQHSCRCCKNKNYEQSKSVQRDTRLFHERGMWVRAG